jgi:hypothetical protein
MVVIGFCHCYLRQSFENKIFSNYIMRRFLEAAKLEERQRKEEIKKEENTKKEVYPRRKKIVEVDDEYESD